MPQTHLTEQGPRRCEAASPETCPIVFEDGDSPHFDNRNDAQQAWEQRMEQRKPSFKSKFRKQARRFGAAAGVLASMATLTACNGTLSVTLPDHVAPTSTATSSEQGHSGLLQQARKKAQEEASKAADQWNKATQQANGQTGSATATNRKNATVKQSELNTANSDLSQLSVRPDSQATYPGYANNRTKLFGKPWTDVDHNGCKTRDDILKRDLSNVTFVGNSRCTVATGDLVDPYTGKMIHFTRGEETSSAIQIDHMVSLGDAWNAGAWTWDAGKRLQLANDPNNLLAVDGPSNEKKGDKTADQWTPQGYACRYVISQIEVKKAYGLSTTAAEKNAMRTILQSECTVVG